jgi:ABC-type multidrug transport system ATPase subunit
MKITDLKITLGNFSLSIAALRINQPGIYGLIGPNGCGKTTAAKLIMGLLPATSGNVDWEGLSAREVTYLPQKPYMMTASVEQNLVYPMKLRGTEPDAERTNALLAAVGLFERRKQNARTLSSGEQQKLALMRAMIFRPRFIIMDEALTDLDIDSLDKAEELIIGAQKRDSTIFFIISHQLPHVKRLCGSIFFMEGGRIVESGSAEQMLGRPEHPGLRRYLKHEVINS